MRVCPLLPLELQILSIPIKALPTETLLFYCPLLSPFIHFFLFFTTKNQRCKHIPWSQHLAWQPSATLNLKLLLFIQTTPLLFEFLLELLNPKLLTNTGWMDGWMDSNLYPIYYTCIEYSYSIYMCVVWSSNNIKSIIYTTLSECGTMPTVTDTGKKPAWLFPLKYSHHNSVIILFFKHNTLMDGTCKIL